MKFQCGRCNRRYSIAEERVRGKVLKIRCRNCQGVITVRDESKTAQNGNPGSGAGSGPGSGAGTRRRPAQGRAAQGALQRDAQGGPGRQAPASPANPETEWYLAVHGGQAGPFSLQQAMDWVAARAPTDELFCWSDSLDDWVPVEEVSHFRNLRSAPADRAPTTLYARHLAEATDPGPASGAAAAAGAGGGSRAAHASPQPMPDAAADHEPRPRKNGASASGAPATVADLQDALDVEIGEASRVVKLAALPGHLSDGAWLGKGTAEPRPGVAKLPKPLVWSKGRPVAPDLAAAAGSGVATSAPSVGAPRQRSHIFVLPAGGAVLLVITALWAWNVREEMGERGPLVSSSRPDQDLAFRSERPRREKVVVVEKRVPSSAHASRRERSALRDEGRGDDASPGGGESSLAPLRPEDVVRKSLERASKFGTSRCYRLALKRNPFLREEIGRIYVTLSVAPSGAVDDLGLSSQESSQLGRCLASTIRRWQFRASSQGVKARIPLVFE